MKIYHAESTVEADQILQRTPEIELITLDIHMPLENGPTWLERFRKSGGTLPVIIVSDSSSQEAEEVFGILTHGAQEYFVKGDLQKSPEVLVSKIRELAGNKKKAADSGITIPRASELKLQFKPDLIVIGASTGGPEALTSLLRNIPKGLPPIIIVQHIYPSFSSAFAKQLCKISGYQEAKMEQPTVELSDGNIYIAHDDYHLMVSRNQGKLYVNQDKSPAVNGHRPSVDQLFSSVAKISDLKVVSLLLTGMGRDGATGMSELKKLKHSFNLVQDAASSVVYGMPREAAKLGAAHCQANIAEARKFLEDLLNSHNRG